MNRTDIDFCANYFQDNYLKTFYLVITYNGKSFILIGERAIIQGNPVSTAIIPNNIATTSKMYKKALNFAKSTDIFWRNNGPLTVNYNPALSG